MISSQYGYCEKGLLASVYVLLLNLRFPPCQTRSVPCFPLWRPSSSPHHFSSTFRCSFHFSPCKSPAQFSCVASVILNKQFYFWSCLPAVSFWVRLLNSVCDRVGLNTKPWICLCDESELLAVSVKKCAIDKSQWLSICLSVSTFILSKLSKG